VRSGDRRSPRRLPPVLDPRRQPGREGGAQRVEGGAPTGAAGGGRLPGHLALRRPPGGPAQHAADGRRGDVPRRALRSPRGAVRSEHGRWKAVAARTPRPGTGAGELVGGGRGGPHVWAAACHRRGVRIIRRRRGPVRRRRRAVRDAERGAGPEAPRRSPSRSGDHGRRLDPRPARRALRGCRAAPCSATMEDGSRRRAWRSCWRSFRSSTWSQVILRSEETDDVVGAGDAAVVAHRSPQEGCRPMVLTHSSAVTTSACRGNTFSVSTRCTSGSASRQPSARTVRP
jgi:hypothetical protein